MKKLIYLVIVALMVGLCSTSCVSRKRLIYFQGSDTLYAQARKIMQQYEMRIKPADQLMVKVACSDPELLSVFRQDVVIGSGGYGSYAGGMAGSLGNGYGFTVNNFGDILLPIIGKVHVADLTTEACAQVIEDKIIASGLVNNPDVTVHLMNARVTVLGAVGSPRVVSLTSERNTIMDVLAQCGDVSDIGLHQHLRVFREEDGSRRMYELDLTKAEVFDSPAYYMQQNDMIYVLPNRSKGVKASPLYTFLSAGSTILAAVMSVLSFAFLIWNKTK